MTKMRELLEQSDHMRGAVCAALDSGMGSYRTLAVIVRHLDLDKVDGVDELYLSVFEEGDGRKRVDVQLYVADPGEQGRLRDFLASSVMTEGEFRRISDIYEGCPTTGEPIIRGRSKHTVYKLR